MVASAPVHRPAWAHTHQQAPASPNVHQKARLATYTRYTCKQVKLSRTPEKTPRTSEKTIFKEIQRPSKRSRKFRQATTHQRARAQGSQSIRFPPRPRLALPTSTHASGCHLPGSPRKPRRASRLEEPEYPDPPQTEASSTRQHTCKQVSLTKVPEWAQTNQRTGPSPLQIVLKI